MASLRFENVTILTTFETGRIGQEALEFKNLPRPLPRLARNGETNP
jgi:hypothetical protein